MLKRKKGRLLLTLLVITGLAGTLKDSTLSNKERKSLTTSFKESKTAILASVKGLSRAQLDFRNSSHMSIRESFRDLVRTEKILWSTLETTMQAPITPEKRSLLRLQDHQLVQNTAMNDLDRYLPVSFGNPSADAGTLAVTVDQFKTSRTQHLKYIKTTTEDLRNHLIELRSGWVDCYQFILIISAYSDRYLNEVEMIKNDPAYPSRK
jgi:hypothetical protein